MAQFSNTVISHSLAVTVSLTVATNHTIFQLEVKTAACGLHFFNEEMLIKFWQKEHDYVGVFRAGVLHKHGLQEM